MAYTITDPRIGLQPIAAQSDSSAPNVKVGTIVRAEDPIYGAAEFIYLPGVASCTVGSLVSYIQGSGQNTGNNTVAMNPNTKDTARPVAVAMYANTSATKYSWYCIQGVVPVKKTAVKVNPNVALFQSATTGRVMPTVTSGGLQLIGVRAVPTATVASATSTVLVELNRPHTQGIVV